ncbi:hypothetical protein HD806DRAFT_542439 [Xylariaceae sp. AK1471]|nr:hypothetical protein HD806DRAFT_542439 [Xylariaceae sp. AK1471]
MPKRFSDAFAQLKKPLWSNSDLPPVRLTNPAAEFVNNRIEINGFRSVAIPAKEDGSPVDNSEKKPVSIPKDGPDHQEEGQEDIHCKHFAEVLRDFEATLPDKHKTKFNLHGKHTWSEVIVEADKAEKKYLKKADKESPYGRVRGFFRSLQRESPVIESWLCLLPTESNYGSLVCGGFKMILGAAARMDEIKEFIVKAMAAIPDEVERAQLMIDYNQDVDTGQRLYRRVSSLYRTVFRVLEHIIHWYRQRSITRHFKAVLQQSAYERELEDRVNEFKEAVLEVQREVGLCGSKRQYRAYKDTQAILQALGGFLRSNPLVNPRTGQLVQVHHCAQPPPPRGKTISRQTLCEAVLRYEEEIPLADLNTILRRGGDFDLEEQDRIVYVIESHVMRNWLLEPQNAVLLVRGNSYRIEGTVSAMSFLAAHVVQSTRNAQRPGLLCLYWFVGQHRNARKDVDANVHGIMRSIIGQLVYMHNGFDLSFITGRMATAIRDNNLKVLCNVFDELIFQLPKKTVIFCVIDWIACLECRQKDDVKYILHRLRKIASCLSEKGKVFKLLLTNGSGGFRSAALFGRRQTLNVPEYVDGNRMGFNKLMWEVKVSPKIEHLAGKSKR